MQQLLGSISTNFSCLNQTQEQGLEVAGKLIDSGAVDLLIVDSVAALVPRAEIDGISGIARWFTSSDDEPSAQTWSFDPMGGTIAIFISQLRRKKLGSCLGIPEPHPVVVPLNSMLPVRLDVHGNTQIKEH